jgi:hypothetical protein
MSEAHSEVSKATDRENESNVVPREVWLNDVWGPPPRSRDVAIESKSDSTQKAPDIEVEAGNKTGKSSDQFKERTAKIINALPEDVKQLLRSKNVKIVAAPGFDVPAPPGALGVFDDRSNTVTISERAHLRRPDEVLSATAYHEVGHAIDGKALNLSSDAEFQKALAADRKALSLTMKRSLVDYMSKDEDAYAESFAESFAYRQVERTGGKIPAQFMKTFQHTIAYMRKKYP